MVNLSGISFDHRMTEDTGASVVDVTRAWVVAREVLDFAGLWEEIDALTGDVPLDVQLDLFLDCRRMAERCGAVVAPPSPPADRHRVEAVAQFRPGLASLARSLEPVLVGRMADVVQSRRGVATDGGRAGGPRRAGRRVAAAAHRVRRHRGRRRPRHATSPRWPRVEWSMFDGLDLIWLWDGIGALPRSDRWQTQARSAVRDDLLTALAELTEDGDRERRRNASNSGWRPTSARSRGRMAMLTEIRRAERYDLTTLSVALRQLRNLALTSVTRLTRASVALNRHVQWPPASGSRPRPRGSSTSAGRARRCTTGRSPGASAARSCCASRTPTRPATGRSGRRASSTRWRGSASRADDPVFEGPYFQSANAAQHVAAAERLFADGHAYYCDLTGEQIQERAKASGRQGYDGYSRDRGLGPAPGRVLRFRVPDGATVVHDVVRGDVEFDNDTIEDFVLLRGNGTPVFVLANVVDDIEMGITHVVRGEEHLPNTPKQQLMWQALGHEPPVWAHVPVLVNEQRKKLSKRRDKVALEQYRDEGYLAEAMVNYLMTLGWAPKGDTEIVPWKRDRGRVPPRGRHPLAGLLRPQEARRLQRRVHPGDAARRVRRRLRRRGFPSRGTATGSPRIAPHVQSRIVTLADAAADGRLPVRRRAGDRRGGVGQGDEAPTGRRRCSTR